MGMQKECIELDNEELLVAIENKKQIIIDEILERETGITIKLLEWKSKYNSYVVYDYEPLCSDGFILNYHISGDNNKLKFLKSIIENTLEKRALLERCFESKSAQVHYEVQR